MGLVLYVDRILRQEIIFDSSALTCTVFVAHVLNVCRSSIAHVDSSSSGYGRGGGSLASHMLLLQHHDPHETQMRQGELMSMMSMPLRSSDSSSSNTTTLLPALLVDSVSNTAAHLSDQQIHMLYRIPWWQENVAYMLYVVASILLLLDIDIVGMVLPSSHCATSTCVLLHNPSSSSQQNVQRGGYSASSFTSRDNASCGRGGTGNSNVIRVSTVVTHCIIVGMILQLGVDQATFMTPAKVMARSFVFMGLSICWTYAVGISDHCAFNGGSSNEEDAAACDHLGCHGPHEVSTEYDSIVLTNSSSNIRRKGVSIREGNVERAMHHHSSSSHRDGSSNSGKNTRAAAAATFVQGFTPCQLRFTVLLLSDSWHMPLAALAMGFIMIDRLQKLACTGASSLPLNHQNGCSRPVHKKAAKMVVMSSARGECEQLQAPDPKPRVEFSSSSSSSFNKGWEAELHTHHVPDEEERDFGKLASAQETDEEDILSLFRQAQRHAGMMTGPASVPEKEGGHQQQLYAAAFPRNSVGIRDSNERLGEMI
jgi:hypothetical protein